MELQYLHSKINQEINQFPASSQTQRQRRWMKSRTRSKRVDRLIKWNLRASGNFGGRRHWKEDHVAPHRFVWVRPLKTWFTCMELIKVERKGQKKKKTPPSFFTKFIYETKRGTRLILFFSFTALTFSRQSHAAYNNNRLHRPTWL